MMNYIDVEISGLKWREKGNCSLPLYVELEKTIYTLNKIQTIP